MIGRKVPPVKPSFISYYDTLDRVKLGLIQPWSLAILGVCLLDIALEVAVWALIGTYLQPANGTRSLLPGFRLFFFLWELCRR